MRSTLNIEVSYRGPKKVSRHQVRRTQESSGLVFEEKYQVQGRATARQLRNSINTRWRLGAHLLRVR